LPSIRPKSLYLAPPLVFNPTDGAVPYIRAVATFEAATEAAASVVFRTVASVKTITSSSRILHLMTAGIIIIAVTYNRNCKRLSSSRALRITDRSFMGMPHHVSGSNFPVLSVNLIPVPLSLTCLFMLLPHFLTMSTHHFDHP